MEGVLVAHIHPSAVLDKRVELADGVEVGPYVVIEGPVRIGAGTIIRPHAHLVGPMTLGEDNYVGTGAVLGERPQDMKYNGQPTETIIGSHNVFREHVTVHRGSVSATGRTVLGDHNFLMAGAHVGHDTMLGNHVVMANGSMLGGHCVIEDRVFISGCVATQQFTRVGRLVMASGHASISKDVPPFMIVFGRNEMTGVNVVGLRRAGFSTDEITAIRHAYRILFLRQQPMSVALTEVEESYGQVGPVSEIVRFIRQSPRGVGRADVTSRAA
jgi:UDP-N-acetylglucosamine acyltransferase